METTTDLINTYDKYIKLLIEEISELAVFAKTHGWRSTRYEQGIKMRKEIERIKNIVIGI